MRKDPYKEIMFKKWLIPRIVGAGIILMTILIVVILVQMLERDAIFNEGMVKSIPMIRDDTVAKLGDIYVRKENEFESELKNIILGIANRKNKRGDEIYYGVNGKRNIDEMINNDYVNGVNLKYIKSDSNRTDGESNFNDIISVLSAIYGADSDRYEEEVINMFEYLFDISHTYTSESTDLYSCEHGCSYVKYYCGDYKVVGPGQDGEEVKFYRCDEYMGEAGQYGLMYNPFIINKSSSYPYLREIAGDETSMRTAYQYKDVKITYTHTEDGTIENHNIVTKGDRVVAQDDDIFTLVIPDGFCDVCSGKRQTFTSTTRKFAGCVSHVECHCVNAESTIIYKDADDETGDWVDWHMGDDKGTCENYNVENADCNHDCECEDECTHECADPELLDTGYYICEGHRHYACPGHIAVCCFGHTTLNLDVNILYYEGIINELEKIKDKN